MMAADPSSTHHSPARPIAARVARGWPRLSIAPARHGWQKLRGRAVADIFAAAAERWEIAPASVMEVRRAKMLPGQLTRIRGAQFGTVAEVAADFTGGHDAIQPPTTGYRVRDALLIDGVLYAGDAARHLRPRATRLPAMLMPREQLCAASYESWLGNRWFGNWLSDDCLTYRLAQHYGDPFASVAPGEAEGGHKAAYERALDMHVLRRSCARFEELLLFDDQSHNAHKRRRAVELRLKLAGDGAARHPGIFLLRGRTGDPRLLVNEREIAERLAARRGFAILDPSTASLDEIVAACRGAMVVAGVEGSHLVHGLMVMPGDARAFVIQPPDRAVSALKRLTDRQGQDYALLVGVGTHEAFSADGDDVERTLDIA